MKPSWEIVRQVARKLNVDLGKISLEDLRRGMVVETEHKDLDSTPETTSFKDWLIYGKIAYAHLKESPRYYEELSKMEKKLKEWIFKPL